jgi:hypothetical protein
MKILLILALLFNCNARKNLELDKKEFNKIDFPKRIAIDEVINSTPEFYYDNKSITLIPFVLYGTEEYDFRTRPQIKSNFKPEMIGYSLRDELNSRLNAREIYFTTKKDFKEADYIVKILIKDLSVKSRLTTYGLSFFYLFFLFILPFENNTTYLELDVQVIDSQDKLIFQKVYKEDYLVIHHLLFYKLSRNYSDDLKVLLNKNLRQASEDITNSLTK